MNILHDLDLIKMLYTRAAIRRSIETRKSVQEGKPDKIADLLDAAAARLDYYYWKDHPQSDGSY